MRKTLIVISILLSFSFPTFSFAHAGVGTEKKTIYCYLVPEMTPRLPSLTKHSRHFKTRCIGPISLKEAREEMRNYRGPFNEVYFEGTSEYRKALKGIERLKKAEEMKDKELEQRLQRFEKVFERAIIKWTHRDTGEIIYSEPGSKKLILTAFGDCGDHENESRCGGPLYHPEIITEKDPGFLEAITEFERSIDISQDAYRDPRKNNR